MKLVVNTNRIIAALVKDSVSRKILLSSKFVFFSLHFSVMEIKKYKRLILKKTKLSENEFLQLMDLLFSNVIMIEDSEISQKALAQAKKEMDPIDKSDTVFVAASLSLECDGIWSEDKHFLRQKLAKVFSTEKLAEML